MVAGCLTTACLSDQNRDNFFFSPISPLLLPPYHSHSLSSFNWQFPEHPYGDLLEKVILFKHNGDNTLLPLGEEDTIEDGMIVEIILAGGCVLVHLCVGRWVVFVSVCIGPSVCGEVGCVRVGVSQSVCVCVSIHLCGSGCVLVHPLVGGSVCSCGCVSVHLLVGGSVCLCGCG